MSEIKMDEFDPNSPGHIQYLRLNGGKYHGKDGLGVMDIEFPDMIGAASWVQTYDYENRVFLREDRIGRSFADPVTISLYPEGY